MQKWSYLLNGNWNGVKQTRGISPAPVFATLGSSLFMPRPHMTPWQVDARRNVYRDEHVQMYRIFRIGMEKVHLSITMRS